MAATLHNTSCKFAVLAFMISSLDFLINKFVNLYLYFFFELLECT